MKSIRQTALADDTAIVASGNTEEELKSNVEAAMRAVTEWAEQAEIKLNTSKTEIISIGQIKIDKLQIWESEVKVRNSLKYPGVQIDEKLNFKNHVEYLENKTKKLLLRVQPMCWTKERLKLRDKLRLFRQVFRPMITYGHEIWFE